MFVTFGRVMHAGKMAVRFLWALVFASSAWVVFSMPVLQRSKTSGQVSSSAENSDDILVRVKKAMVLVGTCPKGMIWYTGKCRSVEEYNRLQDEDYDEVQVPAIEPVPVTHKAQEEVVDEYTDAVNPIAKSESGTETVVSVETHLQTTDAYDNTLVGSTTVSSLDNNSGYTSDKRNTLMTTVFVICSLALVMIWLIRMLYNGCLRKEEDERDTSSLASFEENIHNITASSHFLTSKLPMN